MTTGRAVLLCLTVAGAAILGGMAAQAQAATLNVANCGVVNELGARQKAANNFSGSASGPAGGPPANVPCNTTAGTTPVDPVAVRPFPFSR